MLEKCEWKGAPRRDAAGPARSAAIRRKARRLVREGGLARVEIARRCGVHPRTLGKWIAAGRWTVGKPAEAGPAGKLRSAAKPRSVAGPRLAGPVSPDHGPADVEMGDTPGLDPSDQGPAEPIPGLDGATLRRRLRHHVARQIAVLDAQLGEGFPASPRATDSARVLRDVTGLKRVIDALDLEDAARGGTGETSRAGGPDLGVPGILALREAIARRYEAFAGDGHLEAVPGEPAR